MSGPAKDSDFNTQIYDEACTWFIEMRAGDVDAAGRQGFNTWIRKSPEHLRAYLEISEIWDDAPLVDAQRTRTSEELLAEAREGREIVPLHKAMFASFVEQGSPKRSNESMQQLRHRGWLSLAAAVGGVLILAGVLMYHDLRVTTYVTGIGEQRILVLADGSRVELNSQTRIAVKLGDRERDVDLLEGQALFKVAKNPLRPFIVRSSGLAVRAVGTEFDVDRKHNATTVTVLEGRVAISTSAPDLQTVAIPDLDRIRPVIFADAGEQVTGGGDAPLHATRANVSAVTAWTRGALVFAGTRLADVVEEFNRHNQRQLIIHDRSLEDMQISGVYASTDPTLLVRFLREQPSVRVDETDAAILIFAK